MNGITMQSLCIYSHHIWQSKNINGKYKWSIHYHNHAHANGLSPVLGALYHADATLQGSSIPNKLSLCLFVFACQAHTTYILPWQMTFVVAAEIL